MSHYYRLLRGFVPRFTRFRLLLVAICISATAVPALSQEEGAGSNVEPAAATVARTVKVVSATGAVGTDLFVEVELEAQGNEAGLQYSVHFDPTVLSISSVNGVNANPDITAGSGAPAGTNLNVNAADAANGNVGVGQNFNGANTNPPSVVSAGTKRIARFKFHILSSAAAGTSSVTFTSNPINRLLFDENGILISTPPFTDGNVTVGPAAPSLVSISGRTTTPGGNGLRNATVFLVDPIGVRRTTTTSSFGFYQFDSVETGKTYTLGVISRSFRFSSRSVNVTGNLADMDFVGLE